MRTDEVLMLFGVNGFCADCGEERLLLPVDDDRVDHCCTGCDGAVTLHGSVARPREAVARRAG